MTKIVNTQSIKEFLDAMPSGSRAVWEVAENVNTSAMMRRINATAHRYNIEISLASMLGVQDKISMPIELILVTRK